MAILPWENTMSVLGYSELLKEIYGITPESIESEISQLLKSKPNEKKIKILKNLAGKERATVSELLRGEKMPNTGGSFLAMTNFFLELEKLKILNKEEIGRRTYFSFPDSSLKKWLEN